MNMDNVEQIRRLGSMSMAEFRFRLAQKLRISRERISLKWNRDRSILHDARGTESTIDESTLHHNSGKKFTLAEFPPTKPHHHRERPKFYFSDEELTGIVSAYRESFPHRIPRIVEEAESLRVHRMAIFGYAEVNCGKTIAWRKDLIHGIESGLEHWSRIAYLDFSKAGDSKIVWEPNRHQHLVTLALAYTLTGDERYAEECFSQWEHWHRENPYLRGINWASSLELAFRTWSWIWMYQLLAASHSITDKRRANLSASLAQHADFIAGNLSIYYSPNTHLLGEGFALFVIGLLFPGMRHSETYKETGKRILLEEITRQVRDDGSHAEQSTFYHRYATDFFLCAAILADRNDCSFPDTYREALGRMMDFMMHSAWPNGTHPMVGDADGGQLLPFGVRDPNDHRSTLSTAAVYFERSDLKNRSGQVSEETLWLLGPDAATRFKGLGSNPPAHTSRAFLQSGLVVMRSDWQSNANMSIFDAGPQGMGGCGHGHADALSVLCSAQGTNWLVDPGTYVYTASQEGRDYFRSTRAHNTLVVDGQGQSLPGGSFKWLSVCPARLESWTTLPSLDYASGIHEGYTRLAKPVVHRRRIIFLKPDRWFLLDELSGQGTHSLEFFFHFSPDVQLRIDERMCWATRNDSHFVIMADPRLTLRVGRGQEGNTQGWFSPDYGRREPAPVLAAETRCSVPSQFAWMLWPSGPKEARLRQVLNRGLAWTLEDEKNVDHFLFSNQIPMQPETTVATDAEFAHLRQNRDHELEQLTLIEGSWLSLASAFAFSSRKKLKSFHAVRQGELLEVLMEPVGSFSLSPCRMTSLRLNGVQVAFQNKENGIEFRGAN
jgi:hypothetical protein